MSTKLLIAADIVPVKTNIKYFVEGDAEYLVGKALKKRLNSADFIALNLEVPLVDSASPIKKCGPCLIAPTNTILGLKAINPFFFTLANNHILDQGEVGLKSTMNILKNNGISFAGAGENIEAAKKPFIKNINNHRIGFYCCAEHEFSIAGKNNAGANPFDPLESFDDIRKLKEKCDYIVVLYHGGKELYRYPSPMLQKIFRKFSDCGANLVIAQHTHCIGCMEEYNGSTLIYGQGNFLFDNSTKELWKTALLLEVEIMPDGIHSRINYIPIVKKGETVREAEGEQKKQILEGFQERSKDILKDGYIEAQYDRLAKEMATSYILRFSGGFRRNIFVRILNKLTGFRFIRSLYTDKSNVAIENVLDCESHRELAARIMKKETF